MKEKKKGNKAPVSEEGSLLSRKDAMKKIGLTAFSAATMMVLLNNPAKADQGDSPDLPPDWP